jgi:hypothetical protein
MSKISTYRSRNFLVLVVLLFGSLSGTAIIIGSVFKWYQPFGALYRMFEYHNEHPLQYIAIVSVVFGIVGANWVDRYGHTTGYWRWLTMTITMLLAIIIASPFGGMLWHIHDMQHGFVPENYLSKVLGGIIEGLEFGWLIALLSIPINLVGFAIGYLSLDRLSKSTPKRHH